ncbi:MAG: hypothetical protein VB092_07530 [Oscillospiraceae bacterium]|nr:hypothetical protein [Oscillospiraceae bacterium]
MYNKDMVARCCLALHSAGYSNDIVEKEFVDGFKEGVRSIIATPSQVEMLVRVKQKYDNHYTRIGMIIGYPYGGLSTEYKVHLMNYAVENGLDEIDLGVDISAMLSGDWKRAQEDLQAVIAASQGKVTIVPLAFAVRIPLWLLDKICAMYVQMGINRVKTSPGNHFGTMELEHVEYIARRYAGKLEIEVAGRCRTREKAEKMVEAGAESFHLSSWRRISGIGNDVSFDFSAKQAKYAEYRDRLE